MDILPEMYLLNISPQTGKLLPNSNEFKLQGKTEVILQMTT